MPLKSAAQHHFRRFDIDDFMLSLNFVLRLCAIATTLVTRIGKHASSSQHSGHALRSHLQQRLVPVFAQSPGSF